MTRHIVTIVPPAPPINGEPCKTQATKVLLEDGSELGNVTRIVLSADINDVWRAQINVIPSMGVMKGMDADIIEGKLSWWRRLLCRMAGVQLHATTLDSTSYQYRLP